MTRKPQKALVLFPILLILPLVKGLFVLLLHCTVPAVKCRATAQFLLYSIPKGWTEKLDYRRAPVYLVKGAKERVNE